MPEIYQLPGAADAIESRSFRLRSGNLTSKALFSGEVTPYGPTEQRWIANLVFPWKDQGDWRELSGIIT
jgi:hypothetical protein